MLEFACPGQTDPLGWENLRKALARESRKAGQVYICPKRYGSGDPVSRFEPKRSVASNYVTQVAR